jgi:hypothetical protein
MHQLLCGVDDAVLVDGYRIEILEVCGEAVRIGLSTRGNDRVVHEITLPATALPRPAARWQGRSTRPTVN